MYMYATSLRIGNKYYFECPGKRGISRPEETGAPSAVTSTEGGPLAEQTNLRHKNQFVSSADLMHSRSTEVRRIAREMSIT
jgi:hypothetical protein